MMLVFCNDDEVGDNGYTVDNVVGGDDDDDNGDSDYRSSRTMRCRMMMIYILQVSLFECHKK